MSFVCQILVRALTGSIGYSPPELLLSRVLRSTRLINSSGGLYTVPMITEQRLPIELQISQL